MSRGSRPVLQIQQLAKAWQLTEEEEKPNPVTQRVKIIMVSVFQGYHSKLKMTWKAEASRERMHSLGITVRELIDMQLPRVHLEIMAVETVLFC